MCPYRLDIAMTELYYQNNPKSLFRKYAFLVTSLTRHQLFRDYLDVGNLSFAVPTTTTLLLPNGFRQYLGYDKGQHFSKTVVSSQANFSSKLYPALYYLDAAAPFLRSLEDAEHFLFGQLGLLKPLEHWSEYREILKWFPHYATTTTVYPDADPETTSVDGDVRQSSTGDTFATLRAAAGTSAQPSAANSTCGTLNATTVSDNYDVLIRFIALFDTSSIPDTDTIDSATLSFHGRSKSDQMGGTHGIGIVTSTPASNTDLVAGDYAQLTTTRQATDISIASWSTVGYNDFALNATGLGNISKTGVSKFGSRLSFDIDNSAPTWGSEESVAGGNYAADDAGTTRDPKLVVVHAGAAGGAAGFMTTNKGYWGS